MRCCYESHRHFPICPLMTRPSHQCRRGDEALFGMTLEVLEATRTGWYQVEAPYRYGAMPRQVPSLRGQRRPPLGRSSQAGGLQGHLRRALRPRRGVLALVTPDPGALVSPSERPTKGLAAGGPPRRPGGVYKMQFSRRILQKPFPAEENAFRAAVTATARSYLGVHYRWGSKTPMGIDCSGLTSMSYLLSGVVIYRDAEIRELPRPPHPPPLHAPRRLAVLPRAHGHVSG